MSWQYSCVFLRPQRSEHAAAHHLGKSDDGVERCTQFVAHIGEEFGFGLVGFLGAVLLVGIFLRKVDQFDGLRLERGLRALEIDYGGAQAKVVVDQFLFVFLDAGDVCADRNVAAVLGAALRDVQPVAVVELRLEGARARRLRRGFLQPGADFRHAADLDHGLIGGARRHRGIRQPVQALEVRVAQHETVFGVPQHESFGDGFDGVAQPQIGFHGFLGKALLLGNIDGDTDQMQAAVAAALAELAAYPQPDPVSAGVLHPEGLVDMVDFAGDQLVGDGEQVDVVGFNQRVDLAEGQEVAAAVEPEHGEHRLRPEDAAARKIPVPQPATAAVERGVDAAAHGVVDQIALAGAGGLPVEREA